MPGAFALPAASEVYLPRFEIKIPQEFGTVKEENWNPSSPSVLVHIQDAHGNYEAQNQIKNLIAHLEKSYGFSVLLLEGSDTELDPSIYHFFKDPALNLKLGDALVKEGELSGAEMHLIEQMENRSQKIRAYGIEKTEFYRDDLRLFKKVYAGEAVYSTFLAEAEQRFEILTGKLHSAPLRKAIRAGQKFSENGELAQHVTWLDAQAKKFLNLDLHDARNQKPFPQILRLIRLKEIEPRIDREAAQKEKEKLAGFLRSFKEGMPFAEKLESVIAGAPRNTQERWEFPRYFFEKLYDAAAPHGFSFKDYPNLSLLGQYLVLQSEMDSGTLFAEIERLSDDLFSALAKNEEERGLIRRMKELALLKKLSKLELTRDDYRKISSHGADSLFDQAMEFYRLAEKREEGFLENIIRRMKESGSGKAILVTGGFHAQGMAEKLKERGISFVSVQPRISNLDQAGNANYLSAMRASKKTIFDRSQISKVLTALGGSGVAARLAEISGDPDYPAYVAKQIVEKALRLAPDAASLLAAEDSSISRLVKLNFSVSLRDQDQLIVSMSFPGPQTGLQVQRFSLELSRFRPDASQFLSSMALAASLGKGKDKGHKKRPIDGGRREKKEPSGGMFSRRQWLAAGGLLSLGAITWGVISSMIDEGGKMNRVKALAETRVLLQELIKELNGQGDPLGPYAEKLLASMKKQDPFVGLRSGLMGVARDPQAGTIAFALNEEAWIPLLEEAGQDKRYREFLKMSLYKEASQWRVAEKDYAPQIQSSEDHVRGEIIRVNDEVMRLTRTKDGDRVGVVPDETLVHFYKLAFAIRMHEEYLGFLDALEYSKRHGFARQRDPGRPELLDDSPLRALRDKALKEGKEQLAGKMGTHLHLLGHIAMAGRTGFPGRKAIERGIKISGSILIFMRQMDDWMSEDAFFYQTLDSLLQMEERGGRGKLDLTTGRIEISNLPNGDIPPAFLEFLTDENYYEPQKIGTLPALDFGKIFIPSQGKGSSLGEEFPENPYWSNMQKRLARLYGNKFIDQAFYERLQKYHAIHEKDVTIRPYGGATVTFRANRIQHTLFPGRPAKGGIRVIFADEFRRDENFMTALADLKAKGATVEQANKFLHHWIRQMTMALALEMSFKTAVMDLPLGGAKSVIPLFEIVEKDGAFVPESVFKDTKDRPSGTELALAARAIGRYFAEQGIVGYDIDVPAPDRNTNPQFMAWMLDEHFKVLAEMERKGIKTSLRRDPELIRRLNEVKREGRQILDPTKTPFANAAASYALSTKVPELATYTGKSTELGGQSIRDQATGLGVLILAELLADKGILKGPTDVLRGKGRHPLHGVRVAIQGFGNVGQNAAILFARQGAHVVAVSDETQGIYTTSHYTWPMLANLAAYANPQIDRPRRFLKDVPFGVMGIPVHAEYQPATYLTDVQPVDILVPAAVENAITERNAPNITARAILPAANGAVNIEAEEMLWNRPNPVFVLPDILTSAGGATMSYQEMLENIAAPLLHPKKSTAWLRKKFKESFEAIWQKLDRQKGIDFGFAADILASERIKKAVDQAASLGKADDAAREALPFKKILIIDEEFGIRSILWAQLKGLPGIETVVTAKTGPEGLEIYRQSPDFDLVITDGRMAGLNGLEVMQAIRALPPESKPDVPIILATAGDRYRDIAQRQELTKYFLAKPFTFENILQVLVEILKDRFSSSTLTAEELGKRRRIVPFSEYPERNDAVDEDSASGLQDVRFPPLEKIHKMIIVGDFHAADLMRMALQQNFSGLEVDIFTRGTQALQAMETASQQGRPYELVFLASKTDEATTPEFLRQLRAHETFRNTLVLASSSNPDHLKQMIKEALTAYMASNLMSRASVLGSVFAVDRVEAAEAKEKDAMAGVFLDEAMEKLALNLSVHYDTGELLLIEGVILGIEPRQGIKFRPYWKALELDVDALLEKDLLTHAYGNEAAFLVMMRKAREQRALVEQFDAEKLLRSINGFLTRVQNAPGLMEAIDRYHPGLTLDETVPALTAIFERVSSALQAGENALTLGYSELMADPASDFVSKSIPLKEAVFRLIAEAHFKGAKIPESHYEFLIQWMMRRLQEKWFADLQGEQSMERRLRDRHAAVREEEAKLDRLEREGRKGGAQGKSLGSLGEISPVLGVELAENFYVLKDEIHDALAALDPTFRMKGYIPDLSDEFYQKLIGTVRNMKTENSEALADQLAVLEGGLDQLKGIVGKQERVVAFARASDLLEASEEVRQEKFEDMAFGLAAAGLRDLEAGAFISRRTQSVLRGMRSLGMPMDFKKFAGYLESGVLRIIWTSEPSLAPELDLAFKVQALRQMNEPWQKKMEQIKERFKQLYIDTGLLAKGQEKAGQRLLKNQISREIFFLDEQAAGALMEVVEGFKDSSALLYISPEEYPVFKQALGRQDKDGARKILKDLGPEEHSGRFLVLVNGKRFQEESQADRLDTLSKTAFIVASNYLADSGEREAMKRLMGLILGQVHFSLSFADFPVFGAHLEALILSLAPDMNLDPEVASSALRHMRQYWAALQETLRDIYQRYYVKAIDPAIGFRLAPGVVVLKHPLLTEALDRQAKDMIAAGQSRPAETADDNSFLYDLLIHELDAPDTPALRGQLDKIIRAPLEVGPRFVDLKDLENPRMRQEQFLYLAWMAAADLIPDGTRQQLLKQAILDILSVQLQRAPAIDPSTISQKFFYQLEKSEGKKKGGPKIKDEAAKFVLFVQDYYEMLHRNYALHFGQANHQAPAVQSLGDKSVAGDDFEPIDPALGARIARGAIILKMEVYDALFQAVPGFRYGNPVKEVTPELYEKFSAGLRVQKTTLAEKILQFFESDPAWGVQTLKNILIPSGKGFYTYMVEDKILQAPRQKREASFVSNAFKIAAGNLQDEEEIKWMEKIGSAIFVLAMKNGANPAELSKWLEQTMHEIMGEAQTAQRPLEDSAVRGIEVLRRIAPEWERQFQIMRENFRKHYFLPIASYLGYRRDENTVVLRHGLKAMLEKRYPGFAGGNKGYGISPADYDDILQELRTNHAGLYAQFDKTKDGRLALDRIVRHAPEVARTFLDEQEAQGSSLGETSNPLIQSILDGNFEPLEEAWKKAELAPWDIQLAGRNLIHLLPLPRKAGNASPRSDAVKQFQTYVSKGIFIVDQPVEISWETHFDPDFGFFVSRKLWDSFSDKRELVKVMVHGMFPEMGGRITNVPLEFLAGARPARQAPYLSVIYKQAAAVIGRISKESGVSAETVLDIMNLLGNTKLTRELLDLFASELNEFYEDVETVMNRDFHDSGLKREMGNADEPFRFQSVMSHVRAFAERWGVVYDREKKRSLRYLSNAFFVEKAFLQSWIEMLEMYIHPERDEILRRKFIEANLAYDLKELEAENGPLRVPAVLMAQMRREAEASVPPDNADSYFNIKIRRILDEDPPKVLQRIKDRYRHWILHFFHHGGIKESEWAPQLEDTVQVFARKTEALVRELRPLIKSIPKIPFVPEAESLGQQWQWDGHHLEDWEELVSAFSVVMERWNEGMDPAVIGKNIQDILPNYPPAVRRIVKNILPELAVPVTISAKPLVRPDRAAAGAQSKLAQAARQGLPEQAAGGGPSKLARSRPDQFWPYNIGFTDKEVLANPAEVPLNKLYLPPEKQPQASSDLGRHKKRVAKLEKALAVLGIKPDVIFMGVDIPTHFMGYDPEEKRRSLYYADPAKSVIYFSWRFLDALNERSDLDMHLLAHEIKAALRARILQKPFFSESFSEMSRWVLISRLLEPLMESIIQQERDELDRQFTSDGSAIGYLKRIQELIMADEHIRERELRPAIETLRDETIPALERELQAKKGPPDRRVWDDRDKYSNLIMHYNRLVFLLERIGWKDQAVATYLKQVDAMVGVQEVDPDGYLPRLNQEAKVYTYLWVGQDDQGISQDDNFLDSLEALLKSAFENLESSPRLGFPKAISLDDKTSLLLFVSNNLQKFRSKYLLVLNTRHAKAGPEEKPRYARLIQKVTNLFEEVARRIALHDGFLKEFMLSPNSRSRPLAGEPGLLAALTDKNPGSLEITLLDPARDLETLDDEHPRQTLQDYGSPYVTVRLEIASGDPRLILEATEIPEKHLLIRTVPKLRQQLDELSRRLGIPFEDRVILKHEAAYREAVRLADEAYRKILEFRKQMATAKEASFDSRSTGDAREWIYRFSVSSGFSKKLVHELRRQGEKYIFEIREMRSSETTGPVTWILTLSPAGIEGPVWTSLLAGQDQESFKMLYEELESHTRAELPLYMEARTQAEAKLQGTLQKLAAEYQNVSDLTAHLWQARQMLAGDRLYETLRHLLEFSATVGSHLAHDPHTADGMAAMRDEVNQIRNQITPFLALDYSAQSLGQNVIVSFKNGKITASYRDLPLLEETPAGEREFPHELRRFSYKGPDALDVRKMLLDHPLFKFDPNAGADSTKNRLQTNWWPGPLENHVGILGSWQNGVAVTTPPAAAGKSIKLAQYFFRYEPDSKTIIFNYLGELWQDERVRGSGFFVKLLRRIVVENSQAEKLVVQELPAQVIEGLPETTVPRMSPEMIRSFFAPIVEAFGFLQWDDLPKESDALLGFRIVREKLAPIRELPAKAGSPAEQPSGQSLGAMPEIIVEGESVNSMIFAGIFGRIEELPQYGLRQIRVTLGKTGEPVYDPKQRVIHFFFEDAGRALFEASQNQIGPAIKGLIEASRLEVVMEDALRQDLKKAQYDFATASIKHLWMMPEWQDALKRIGNYQGMDLKTVRKFIIVKSLQATRPYAVPDENALKLFVPDSQKITRSFVDSLRAILNQPSLRIEVAAWSRYLEEIFTDPGERAKIVERIRKTVSWEDFNPDSFSGTRSILLHLEKPVIYRGVEYHAIKIKGTAYAGIFQPLKVRYQEAVDTGMDESGRMTKTRAVNFKGGATVPESNQEFAGLGRGFEDGITLDIPLAHGVYPDFEMEGEKGGFMVSLVQDAKDARVQDAFNAYMNDFAPGGQVDREIFTSALLEKGDFWGVRSYVDDFLRRAGRALRDAHDQGHFFAYPHLGNLTEYQGRFFWHDFDSWEDISQTSPVRQIGYRFFDLHQIFSHTDEFSLLRSKETYQLFTGLFGARPVQAILEGYFYDRVSDKRIWQVETVEDVTRILMRNEHQPVYQIDNPMVGLMSDVVYKKKISGTNLPYYAPKVYVYPKGDSGLALAFKAIAGDMMEERSPWYGIFRKLGVWAIDIAENIDSRLTAEYLPERKEIIVAVPEKTDPQQARGMIEKAFHDLAEKIEKDKILGFLNQISEHDLTELVSAVNLQVPDSARVKTAKVVARFRAASKPFQSLFAIGKVFQSPDFFEMFKAAVLEHVLESPTVQGASLGRPDRAAGGGLTEPALAGSLGQTAKLYYESRGYGTNNPLTSEIVARDAAGNFIDRFLLETEPDVFEYLYSRIFNKEDTILVPEAEAFNHDLMAGLRYLGIQPRQQANPVIVEEGITTAGKEDKEQARKIADIAGRNGAVILLWRHAQNGGRKPALRRYLDQYAAGEGILVRDFPLETLSDSELNRVLKSYQQPALALSTRKEPLVLEFNGEKIKIDKQFLDQYHIDPLQALALFKQILDNPPERRKELFEKAGLDFDAANGYWQVTERFITSFLKNAYASEAARKTLAHAA